MRLLQTAELLERVAHVVVGVGEVGLEGKRAAVMGDRRVRIAALEGDAAHQVDGVVVVRVQRQRPLDRRGRLLDLVLVEQNAGVVDVELVDPRLDHERAAQQVGGLVEPVEVLDRQREVVERLGIVGLALERLAVGRFGFLRTLQFAQAGAEIVPGIDERRAAIRARGDRPARLRQSA